jgi:nucleotidyltransferase/DNA polymerase involved in DNA repair
LTTLRTCYWPQAVIHVRRRSPGPVPVATTGGRAADIAPDITTAVALAYRAVPALAAWRADLELDGADGLLLDVTHSQRAHGTPEDMALHVHRWLATGADGSCSVGVAANAAVARLVSAASRPGNVGVITPWETRTHLADISLEHVPGLDPHLRRYLRYYGATTCGDVAAMPAYLLVRRYGAVGRQLWLLCQGRDATPLWPHAVPPQVVELLKVLPPRTARRRTIDAYLRHMGARLAARLRDLDMLAGSLRLELRLAPEGRGSGQPVIAETSPLTRAAPDAKSLFASVRALLDRRWQGEAVTHIHYQIARLRNASGQLELFASDGARAPQAWTLPSRDHHPSVSAPTPFV